MSSILKVNTIQDTDGNNIINENANVITIGASGDTITVPAGATVSGFTSAGIDDNATSTAITISSDEDVTFTEDILLGDNKKAIFGTGLDFEILHNSVTGNLFNLAANPLEIHQVGTNSVLQLYRDPGNGVIAQFFGSTTEAGSIATDTSLLKINAVSALSFSTNNGSERLRILSDGKVGIGTSSPSHNLTVDGGTSTSVSLIKDATGSATVRYYDGGSQKAYIQLTSAEDMDFFAASGVDQIFYGNGAEVMRLSSGAVFNENGGNRDFRIESNNNDHMLFVDGGNDRVGVGTGNPQNKLDISATTWDDGILIKNTGNFNTGIIADANRTSAGGGLLNLQGRWNGTEVTSILFQAGSDTTNKDDGEIVFRTASAGTPTERMRITPAGNVGIGTSVPDEKFHIVDTGSSQAAKIHSDTNNSGVLGVSVLAGLDTPSSSGDCKWVRLADGNDSGKAYIQFKSSSPNAEFAAISDERLKTNIQNTDVVGLDVIKNLRLVKFDWNETATQNAGWSMHGHQKLGFVAQEVEQILPEFISEDTNGFKIMGDSGFVPYLIKAMQEQQTKIQELEARITTLEANNP